MSQQVATELFHPQQLSSPAVLLYTVPANTKTVIRSLWCTNTDSVARWVTVYLVAAGDNPGDQNTITKTMGVPAASVGGAGGGAAVPGAANLVLPAGATIRAAADGPVTIFGSGVEVSG